MITINVPFLPPSVNHYTLPGRFGGRYKTKEAKKFETDFAYFVNGQSVVGKSFSVSIYITLGKGERGDTDNYLKLTVDALADNGVFVSPKGKELSDAYVDQLYVCRDRKSRPETSSMVIKVSSLRRFHL